MARRAVLHPRRKGPRAAHDEPLIEHVPLYKDPKGAVFHYPPKADQEWGVLVWRNYPRDYRYGIYSTPQPRGSNCTVCFLRPLRGLAGKYPAWLKIADHWDEIAAWIGTNPVARIPTALRMLAIRYQSLRERKESTSGAQATSPIAR